MKKLFIIIILLILPALAYAQGTVSLGEAGSISYTSVVENSDGTKLYYNNDELTLSENGSVWIRYQNDIANLEAHDTDGKGEPDVFFELNENEEITKEYGSGIEQFKRDSAVTFDSLIGNNNASNPDDDLVGDISRIDIPGGSSSFLWIILLIILAGGGYWWFKRNKKANTN